MAISSLTWLTEGKSHAFTTDKLQGGWLSRLEKINCSLHWRNRWLIMLTGTREPTIEANRETACSTDVSANPSPQCHMVGRSLAMASRSHPLILSRTALAANSSCRPTPSGSTLVILMVVHSPHTASTGWRKVLLAARPEQVMLCAARLCTSTGQTSTGTASGQTEARQGCWTAHFHPGSAAESRPDTGQQGERAADE